MASRRENATGVSLFPFLAVLMCAMGALILLLLVMTRRIRQQAELRALEEQQSAVVEAAPSKPAPAPPASPPSPPPVVFPELLPPAPPRPRPVVIRRAPQPPAPPPVIVDPTYEARRAAQLEQHHRQQAELDRQWQTRVEQLTQQQAELKSELSQLEATLAQRQSDLQQLAGQAAQAAQLLAETSADPQGELARLAAQRAEVRAEIDAVARQLQAAQARRAAQAGTKFTIVPFDALSGTNRRPIVIECRKDELRFACEGITLTPQELNGFIPHFNPLSAGVKALFDGWSARDNGSPPYVLLIVRPEGTVSFYVARTYLQPLEIPFGYELVGAEQQFTWQPTDDALTRECRRAIDETLRERPRVTQLAHASGRFEEPLSVVGGDGQFRLEEVDRMREPERSVQFGQQRLNRDQFTAGGGGAADGERRGLGLFRKPASGGGAGGTDSEPGDSAPGQSNIAGGSDSPAGQPAATAAGSGSSAGAGWMSSPGFGGKPQVRDPRQWRPALGSGNSVVRDVPVEITRESLRIRGGRPIEISPETDVEVLARHIAEALEEQIQAWGPPPRGFYWKPRIKFIVTAEGAPLSRQLTPFVDAWGLESTLDYASRLSRIAELPGGLR